MRCMYIQLVEKASVILKYFFLSITASESSEGTARCQRAAEKLHRRYPFVDRRKLPATSRSEIPEATRRHEIITNNRNYSMLNSHFLNNFQ